MSEKSTNIYQTARSAAGYTQERAAELIGTSVRSIAAYESGERIPADDIVVRMADIYGTQFLAYQHLRNTMDAARKMLPEVTMQSLPVAILRLQKEVNDFLQCKEEMIAITCDGVIDETERDAWDRIMSEVEDVGTAILALHFAWEDKQ